MKIFILGNRGNMGKRYAAILKFLGHEVAGCDIGENPDFSDSQAIIIATPTEAHMVGLTYLLDCKKPVLCEKPFISHPESMGYLKYFLKKAEEEKMQVSMVSQYDWLSIMHPLQDLNDTQYDYFRSGSDGIAWDCINIIWHAKGRIVLKNQSPIWKCRINGIELDLRDMDGAYIWVLKSWLSEPYVPQYDRILKSHQKVLDYLDGKFN